MKLHVGQRAPDFTLLDQYGKAHALSEYRSRQVLLYFYPKDDTKGCTAEACAIRDSHDDFGEMGIVVLGVSVDPVASHKKFADKYNLPFIILADEKKEVVKKYGVWGRKKFMGREYMGTLRTSFLISKSGLIARIYEQVRPAAHANQVLVDLQR